MGTPPPRHAKRAGVRLPDHPIFVRIHVIRGPETDYSGESRRSWGLMNIKFELSVGTVAFGRSVLFWKEFSVSVFSVFDGEFAGRRQI